MSGESDLRSVRSSGDVPALLQERLDAWAQHVADAGLVTAGDLASAFGSIPMLARLLATSEFAAAIAAREWDWLRGELETGHFDHPLEEAEFEGLEEQIVTAPGDVAALKSLLRRNRNRYLLRILWRNVNPVADLWEVLESLSNLADALLRGCLARAFAMMCDRYGAPVNEDHVGIAPVVLAMGKLGGRELNFSSDVDLIFLYSEEGRTTGQRELSAHEFFGRLARQVVNLMEDVTADGFVYRVDTRLRPYGDSGPPVISFLALENYLQQQGRSWERYAYIKARPICLPGQDSLGRELQANVIDPFVYRGYLDFGVFESLRDMKSLIEAEVKKRELADNLKLGPGGIREIEFIAQSLQLVRGGSDRSLRTREIRTALASLVRNRMLGRESVSALAAAYRFLRRLENGVQAIRDQQVHDLPANDADRARLSLLMGFDCWDELRVQLEKHRDRVARQFSDIVFRTASGTGADSDGRIGALWESKAAAEDWTLYLREDGFEDCAELGEVIARLARDPVQGQMDTTARRRLTQFMPSFLDRLRDKRNPAVAATRVLAIVLAVVRRSAYLSLLNENPAVLDRLIALCGRSEFIAAEIARYPLLLDELLDQRLYSAAITATAMRAELGDQLAGLATADSEQRIEALARFQRASVFRIAVQDVSGQLPIMKVSDRLTELAEIVLDTALQIARTDLVERYGEPIVQNGDVRRTAGFGVIAYGKFGGIELSYGSDLDLIFLHDSPSVGQQTGGARVIDNGMFFGRLVRRLVHFLTTQTPSGAMYEVDTRLRPSGRSGLLVVNLDGFGKYQEDNAWTWEHQALIRARPVAGDAHVAREFENIRRATLSRQVNSARLLEDVTGMRAKMRENLDRSVTDQFDLKQGTGGIGDIEFLVQFLVLKHAASHPSLLFYPDNIRQLGVLGKVGIVDGADVARLQEAYRDYRILTHRLALDGRPALVRGDELLEEREFVIEMWDRFMG